MRVAAKQRDRRLPGISDVSESAAAESRYALIEGRRRSKNSGGGIAPAAIGRLIEAGDYKVNALGLPRVPAEGGEKRRQVTDEVEFLHRAR